MLLQPAILDHYNVQEVVVPLDDVDYLSPFCNVAHDPDEGQRVALEAGADV